MPVLGAVLIAPVLPQMEDHFAGVSGADVLVPIVLAVPALLVGLAAPFAGVVVDAVDRKRLLIVAMIAYSISAPRRCTCSRSARSSAAGSSSASARRRS